MQHKNTGLEVLRRALACATLATLMTFAIFGFVTHVMAPAVSDSARLTAAGSRIPEVTAADSDLPVLELTVVKGRREPVPVVKAEAGNWKPHRLEAI